MKPSSLNTKLDSYNKGYEERFLQQRLWYLRTPKAC